MKPLKLALITALGLLICSMSVVAEPASAPAQYSIENFPDCSSDCWYYDSTFAVLKDSAAIGLLCQAFVCLREQDYISALDLIDGVLATYPDNDKLYKFREDVEKGQALNITLLLVLANTAERQGFLDRALETYLRILEIDPAFEACRRLDQKYPLEEARAIVVKAGKQRVEDQIDAIRCARRALQAHDEGNTGLAMVIADSAVAKFPYLTSILYYLQVTESMTGSTVFLHHIMNDSVVCDFYRQGVVHLEGEEYLYEGEEYFIEGKKYLLAVMDFGKVLAVYPNSFTVREKYRAAWQMLEW